MATKPRVKMEYSFPAVKEAAWETVREARAEWMEIAKETAESKANDQAATRGYALQVGVDSETIGNQSARIFATTVTDRWGQDPWFFRFFEYGAVHIQAMPFMRPAARKANKAFVAKMGDDLDGNIRKRSKRKKRVTR
jgi:hypothetical protein